MKKILLFTLFFFLVHLSFSQAIDTPYQYPVKPGSEKWKSFQSRKGINEACQIPEDILKNLTTKALAETYLNFPLYKDLYFFNAPKTGFNMLKRTFNGFQELFSREDAGQELLKIYESMDPTNINPNWDDTLKGDFTFKFMAIEMILAQDEILSKLKGEGLNALKKAAANKYKIQRTIPAFSPYKKGIAALIIGRIANQQNNLTTIKSKYGADAVMRFLQTGISDNPEMLNDIFII